MIVHTAPWSKGLIALGKQLSEAGPPAAKDAIRERIADYMAIAKDAYPEYFWSGRQEKLINERAFDSAMKFIRAMETEQ
jgi:hypothetical protein